MVKKKWYNKIMPSGVYKRTKEQKNRLKLLRIGKKHTKETIEKLSILNKGKNHPKYGIINSKETRKKISKALTGKKRKPFTEEHKRKMSGENHFNWQGGLSFEPYTTDWTRELRIAIRERDKYTCQLCGEKQGDRAYSVHHIDYDKKNCSPGNLITLCKSCHTKTNFNRDYWIKFFLFYFSAYDLVSKK